MKRILVRLGHEPFEIISIIFISVFVNLLTSVAIDRDAYSTPNFSNILIYFLLILSFLLSIISYIFSKRINEIFIITPLIDREREMGKMKSKGVYLFSIITLLSSFITLLCILLFFNPTNSKNRVDDLKIGYQEISLYQHIFTAQEKRFFNEQGLNVELISFASANQMMEAFLSNNIDVLGLTNTQVALTIEGKQNNQMKFINFLVWENNAFPDYIITRKDANIKTLKDLEGKKIGLHPGSAVRAFSEVVFKHFGLDVSKITTIELKPEIMQSSLIAGSVDAVYCMDPVATTLFLSGKCDTLISNPMQFIFPAPTPISGTAISTKILNEKPEIGEKLIKAIDKAIEYTRNQMKKEEIAEFISKYTPINKEQSIMMNPSVYWTFKEIQPKRVQALSDKFYELGIIDKKINTETMIYQTTQKSR